MSAIIQGVHDAMNQFNGAAHGAHLLVDPTPAVTPGDVGTPTKTVSGEGVLKALIGIALPIVLTVIGIITITRAKNGNVSQALTSSAIVLIGLAFIGGAGTLVFLGGWLVDLIIK